MIKIKSERQIRGIKSACKLVSSVLTYITPYITEGITTKELDDIINSKILLLGGVSGCLGYKGYPCCSCISINEEVCHGIPGKRVLKNGDILNIDITVIKNGFFGDSSRMYKVGEVSEAANKLIKDTYDSMVVGIKQAKVGNYFGDISYAVGEYAKSCGLGVVEKYAGHGVGLALHESPIIPFIGDKGSGAKIENGMVFTIEPMLNTGSGDCLVLEDKWTAVTVDSGLSAQWEHTIAVYNNKTEILTLGDNEEIIL